MKYFFLIIAFVFTMCHHRPIEKKTNNERELSNQIDSVLVTYFCGVFNSTVSIHCEELAEIQKRHPQNDYSQPFGPELIDTFIVNKIILNKIEKLLDNKIPVHDYSEDARMFITIKKKNGYKDYICVKQRANPVKYNGSVYLIDNEIIFLLKYYSGYYLWVDDMDYYWFEELQDSIRYQKVIQQKESFSDIGLQKIN